jgi:hypothetical protein
MLSTPASSNDARARAAQRVNAHRGLDGEPRRSVTCQMQLLVRRGARLSVGLIPRVAGFKAFQTSPLCIVVASVLGKYGEVSGLTYQAWL